MRIDDKRSIEKRDHPGFVTGFFKIIRAFSYYPKVLFEVFVRKNFGERYFYFSRALFLTVILGLWPWAKYKAVTMWNDYKYPVHWDGKEDYAWHFSLKYISWYLFLFLFLICSIKRLAEILGRKRRGQIAYGGDSRHSGDTFPFFYYFGHSETRRKLKAGNLSQEEMGALSWNSHWKVGVILEPAPFLIIGLILWTVGQSAGLPMAICAVLYGLGTWADHFFAEETILNQSDDMVLAQSLSQLFSQGKQEAGGSQVGREMMNEKPGNRKEEDPYKVT